MKLALRIATVAAAAVASLGVATSPATALDSGYDGDTRHCVTHREVWMIVTTMPRDQLERRWEMTDRGTQVYMPGFGRAWIYKMCDGETQIAFAATDNGIVVGVGIADNL